MAEGCHAPMTARPPSGKKEGKAPDAASYYCKDCRMILNSAYQCRVHVAGLRHKNQQIALARKAQREGATYTPCSLIPYTGNEVEVEGPRPRKPRGRRVRGSLELDASAQLPFDVESEPAPGANPPAPEQPSRPATAAAHHPLPLTDSDPSASPPSPPTPPFDRESSVAALGSTCPEEDLFSINLFPPMHPPSEPCVVRNCPYPHEDLSAVFTSADFGLSAYNAAGAPFSFDEPQPCHDGTGGGGGNLLDPVHFAYNYPQAQFLPSGADVAHRQPGQQRGSQHDHHEQQGDRREGGGDAELYQGSFPDGQHANHAHPAHPRHPKRTGRAGGKRAAAVSDQRHRAQYHAQHNHHLHPQPPQYHHQHYHHYHQPHTHHTPYPRSQQGEIQLAATDALFDPSQPLYFPYSPTNHSAAHAVSAPPSSLPSPVASQRRIESTAQKRTPAPHDAPPEKPQKAESRSPEPSESDGESSKGGGCGEQKHEHSIIHDHSHTHVHDMRTADEPAAPEAPPPGGVKGSAYCPKPICHIKRLVHEVYCGCACGPATAELADILAYPTGGEAIAEAIVDTLYCCGTEVVPSVVTLLTTLRDASDSAAAMGSRDLLHHLMCYLRNHIRRAAEYERDEAASLATDDCETERTEAKEQHVLRCRYKASNCVVLASDLVTHGLAPIDLIHSLMQMVLFGMTLPRSQLGLSKTRGLQQQLTDYSVEVACRLLDVMLRHREQHGLSTIAIDAAYVTILREAFPGCASRKTARMATRVLECADKQLAGQAHCCADHDVAQPTAAVEEPAWPLDDAAKDHCCCPSADAAAAATPAAPAPPATLCSDPACCFPAAADDGTCAPSPPPACDEPTCCWAPEHGADGKGSPPRSPCCLRPPVAAAESAAECCALSSDCCDENTCTAPVCCKGEDPASDEDAFESPAKKSGSATEMQHAE
ncbi:hypothetical protein DIPPA_33047 [Diplonema papillatum]|nr:hypothetical protein DIPPA_33047 [Diplonema papillatum]